MHDPEYAAMAAQVPQMRRWITDVICKADTEGLSRETITAALFTEAIMRLQAEHGSLALASILSDLARKYAGVHEPSSTIN